MLKNYLFLESSLTQTAIFLLVLGRLFVFCVLICISLITHEVHNLSTYVRTIFFKELLIQITAYFLLCYLTFLLVICSYSLYNLDINVINIANHFYPQSTICLVNYLCYLFFLFFAFNEASLSIYQSFPSLLLSFPFHYKIFPRSQDYVYMYV